MWQLVRLDLRVGLQQMSDLYVTDSLEVSTFSSLCPVVLYFLRMAYSFSLSGCGGGCACKLASVLASITSSSSSASC